MLCCRGRWAESGVGGRGTPATQADMTARGVHHPVGEPTEATQPGSKCSPLESRPSAAKKKPLSLRMHSKLRQPCMGRGSRAPVERNPGGPAADWGMARGKPGPM